MLLMRKTKQKQKKKEEKWNTGAILVYSQERSCIKVISHWSLQRFKIVTIWATAWQNQQNGMCAKRRLWSVWASLSAWRKIPIENAAKTLIRLRVDDQADLSLHWAHSHFVGFIMKQLICLKVLNRSVSFLWKTTLINLKLLNIWHF